MEEVAEASEGRRPLMRFTLPVPPGVNHYWLHVRGHVVLSSAAKQYKRDAAIHARAAGVRDPLPGSVALTMTVFRKRRAGDLDGYMKGTLDALRGVAYVDDKQVVELHAFRRDDRARPRVEIEVTPVGPQQTAIPVEPIDRSGDVIR